MASETFTFHGKEMEDGRVYFSSKEMPGFRLIVHPGENTEAKLHSAFMDFLPHHMASKARQAARERAPTIAIHRIIGHGRYNFSADYAPA